MKVCPICKARCFDDMETCYGCMHRFEAEREVVASSFFPDEKAFSTGEGADLQPVESQGSAELLMQDQQPDKLFRKAAPRHAATAVPCEAEQDIIEAEQDIIHAEQGIIDAEQGIIDAEQDIIEDVVSIRRLASKTNHSPEGGFQAEYQLVISLKPVVHDPGLRDRGFFLSDPA